MTYTEKQLNEGLKPSSYEEIWEYKGLYLLINYELYTHTVK